MPTSAKLHGDLRSRGLVILAINCQELADPVAFVEKKQPKYPYLLDGDPVAEAYRVKTLPAFYVIGRDGTMLHHQIGFSDEDKDCLVSAIHQALEQKPVDD